MRNIVTGISSLQINSFRLQCSSLRESPLERFHEIPKFIFESKKSYSEILSVAPRKMSLTRCFYLWLGWSLKQGWRCPARTRSAFKWSLRDADNNNATLQLFNNDMGNLHATFSFTFTVVFFSDIQTAPPALSAEAITTNVEGAT